MRIWKYFMLFYLGGILYAAMELSWRGWSHSSMFLLGGLCFLLLGKLGRIPNPLPLFPRALVGALVVTMLELGCGLLINRSYQVWDYRNVPMNFHGQICLPFTALWIVISLVAFFLYDQLERGLDAVIAENALPIL